MPQGSFPIRRWLAAVAIVLVAAVGFATTARADEPAPQDASATTSVRDLNGWRGKSAAQARSAPDCWSLTFTDVEASRLQLVLTDADVLADGDGTRGCVFFDARWNSFAVVLLNQQSISEFRRTKAELQPLFVEAGIDPCRIALWTTPTSSLQRQITLQDRNDTGYYCTPEVISHGPESERRLGEVFESADVSVLTAEEVFGWPFTWPVRVHLYDNHEDFVEGKRVEGGDERANSETLEFAFGVTTILDNGMVGVLVDVSRFPEPTDLRMLLAHEFAHVAQAGLLGDTSMLPFFVVEGGAEYVASLVVGAEQRDLTDRFHTAVVDESRNRAVPLRQLVAQPSISDQRLTSAAYSRGYAAMRFLTDRWGRDAFTRLHHENIGGTPQRFTQNMARLTGMTLDEFDRELRKWLLAQGALT